MNLTDYSIESLPDHIKTSSHYLDWIHLFPNESVFTFNSNAIIPNFDITSQDDLDRIIDADCVLGFSKQSRIEILRKIENYWLYNPNSAPITFPEKDKSFFGNQIRILIQNNNENALVACMKNGYTELFDYIYERENGNINKDGTFDMGVLLHYAVSYGYMEMIQRCINLGIQITTNLIQPAIDGGNVEIFRLLFETNNKIFDYDRNEIICEQAPLDMFKIFLEYYIDKKGRDPLNLIIFAIKNINNLRELLVSYDHLIRPKCSHSYLYEIFRICIHNSVNIESILFIETHYGITIKELKKEIKDSNNSFENYHFRFNRNLIGCTVVLTDNLEVYNYLREIGFTVDELNLRTVLRHRTYRITPGLIRKHILQDEEAQREADEMEDADADEMEDAVSE
jgi:hypothetical protein